MKNNLAAFGVKEIKDCKILCCYGLVNWSNKAEIKFQVLGENLLFHPRFTSLAPASSCLVVSHHTPQLWATNKCFISLSSSSPFPPCNKAFYVGHTIQHYSCCCCCTNPALCSIYCQNVSRALNLAKTSCDWE